MTLPAPVVQTKAQLLRRVFGGQPEQLMLRDFIETVMPGLPSEFGNGFHDDEPYISEALATRRVVSLTPYARYRIGQGLRFTGSDQVLLGNGATIVCTAADFPNTGTNYYDRKTSAIAVLGNIFAAGAAGATTQRNVIRDLRIEFEVQDGRRLVGIFAANTDDLLIENVEIYGGPIGACMRINGCKRYTVRRPYLHDWTDNTTGWTPGNDTQVTGIVVDEERPFVSGVPRDSTKGTIEDFIIENITVGPAFEAVFGYQADGIKGNVNSTAHILDGFIERTGEGIDWFGPETTILGVDVAECEYFSIAFKGGPTTSRIGDCNLENAGICHVYVGAGSDHHADNNHIHDNFLGAVLNGGADHAGLRFEAVGAFDVINSMVNNNTIRPQTGDYAIRVNTDGGNNSFIDNREFAGAVAAFIDLGGAVKVHRPVDFFLSGSKTFDPGNIVDGAAEATTVTVTGAVLGRPAAAGFSLDLQGITLTAYVSATDTVTVRFQNESGGALDLGSGTLTAWVFGA